MEFGKIFLGLANNSFAPHSDKHELLLNNFSSARRRDGSDLARARNTGTGVVAGARDAVAVDVASASERRSRSERESGWRATQFL